MALSQSLYWLITEKNVLKFLAYLLIIPYSVNLPQHREKNVLYKKNSLKALN